MRSAEAAPRWEDPLPVIQNTRPALAYGSVVITCSTSRANGAIPVVSSHRPVTSAVDVPGGQVGQRAAPLVVVLDPHRAGFPGWQGGVAAAPGLDRGLLIGA